MMGEVTVESMLGDEYGGIRFNNDRLERCLARIRKACAEGTLTYELVMQQASLMGFYKELNDSARERIRGLETILYG